MSEHTKEPWRTLGEGDDAFIPDVMDYHSGEGGAYFIDEENVNRIVDCVNACAGIDNETLRKIANKEMDGSEIFELAKVKQQRDELHDNLYELIDFARELVSIVKIHSNATGNNFAWAELESMENAIAKAGEQ